MHINYLLQPVVFSLQSRCSSEVGHPTSVKEPQWKVETIENCLPRFLQRWKIVIAGWHHIYLSYHHVINLPSFLSGACALQGKSKFLIYVIKHSCIQRPVIQRSLLAKKPEFDDFPLIAIDHPETDLLLLDLLLHHPVALLLHHLVVEPHQVELVGACARASAKSFRPFSSELSKLLPRERFGRIQRQLDQTLMVFPFFQSPLTNHDGVSVNFHYFFSLLNTL